jgi:hypothetical protein
VWAIFEGGNTFGIASDTECSFQFEPALILVANKKAPECSGASAAKEKFGQ